MAVHEESTSRFEGLLTKHSEWIIASSDGSLFQARANEICVLAGVGGFSIEIPTDAGIRRLNPDSIEVVEDSIRITSISDTTGIPDQVLLIPRIDIADVRNLLESARMEIAGLVADALGNLDEPLRVKRIDMSAEGGRLARIICEDRWKNERLAYVDVSESLNPEHLMTKVLLELQALSIRKKRVPLPIITILSERIVRGFEALHSTLRPAIGKLIEAFQVESQSGAPAITPIAIADEWREAHGKRVSHRRPTRMSVEMTSEIKDAIDSAVSLDPEAVDFITSSSGWSVRYHGLPFLRIRTVKGNIRCWIGVGERRREIPIEETMLWSGEIVTSLSEYRRHDPPTRRHELYRLASEAWLESMLVRDITRLDPNLIVAPLFSQFRSGPDRIDILALREDGRLVVVEVKVAPDREVLFQSVDYWRKLEAERVVDAGRFSELFGGRKVSNRPPMIYIVAPLLSFQSDFDFLVGCLDPSIRICRFDLNEDWRKQVRVHQRTEY